MPKARDLIRELQKVEGDREVYLGFPSFDEESGEPDGEYDVFPIRADLAQDTVDNQAVVLIFADPPDEEEDEDDEAANDNET